MGERSGRWVRAVLAMGALLIPTSAAAGGKKRPPAPGNDPPASLTVSKRPEPRHGGVIATFGSGFVEFVKRKSDVLVWQRDGKGAAVVPAGRELTVVVRPENRPEATLRALPMGDHFRAAIDLDGVLRLDADVSEKNAGRDAIAHLKWGLLDNKSPENGGHVGNDMVLP